MRIIQSSHITSKIKEAFIEANLILPDHTKSLISECRKKECNEPSKKIFSIMEENYRIAEEMRIPVCQDTGMAVIFAEIGNAVFIEGENLSDAVNRGVREAYTNGNLRLSVVKDPLRRINTNDNTPAIIHVSFTDGENIEFICMPKGFGSENSSRIKMFEPSATTDDITDFIAETVKTAGSNPCPPIIVGVGIGGDFEYSALLAKKALAREEKHNDDFYAEMEDSALTKINTLEIGAQGFGGSITALAVYIESFPTHIAGLPVAVNICCHVSRHKRFII